MTAKMPRLPEFYPNQSLREIVAYMKALEARVGELEEYLDWENIKQTELEKLPPDTTPDLDAAAAETVAEAARELRPDPFKIVHRGRGRFVVQDADGNHVAPEEGFFSKEQANEFCGKPQQSVVD